MMNLQQLLGQEFPPLAISGLAEHTAELQPGIAFMALAAEPAQALAHARQALAQGAAAVLVDVSDGIAAGQKIFAVPELRQQRGAIAARFYEHPSAQMAVAAVTGTNGKTSVAYHIADLSDALGEPAGYFGTLGWGRLNELRDSGLTTSNAVALQRRIACLGQQAQCRRLSLEISSHALDQRRAHDVKVDVGVFTNLSRDHLDYHGDMAAYGQAKLALFTDFPLQLAVLNAGDEFSAQISRACAAPVVSYGRSEMQQQYTLQPDWHWQRMPESGGQMSAAPVVWTTPVGQLQARLPLVGDYAIDNVTAALIVLHHWGASVTQLGEALQKLSGVPGRMEVVSGEAQPLVVVDYAHTPDALANVLQALRSVCRGRLICVVGCGGDRDTGKRPQMAAVASGGADVVWLTSDNPRSEPPAEIIADMAAGLRGKPASQMEDRKEAIFAAIADASVDDVVLLAGKGHEDYQEIMGKRYPFDDRAVARQALLRN